MPRTFRVALAALPLVLLPAAACAPATTDRPDAVRASGAPSAGGAGGTLSTRPTAPSRQAHPTPPAAKPPVLPTGGRTIFPGHRVVAYYGNPVNASLGVLGERSPEASAKRLQAAAAGFAAPGRPVVPAFEMIVSVAQRSAGKDKDFSEPTPASVIARWHQVARAHRMLLVLDVQPGRRSFVDEVKRYEPFLREPDVGLALDPEWRMAPGEVPGKVIGQVDAAEVNAVSAWLAGIVQRYRLPQKLFVVHQFRADMITHRARLVTRPGLATVIHADGYGTRGAKLRTYRSVQGRAPFLNGFKLFYDEDVTMFRPAEVLRLRPAPDFVSYQ